MTVLVQTLIVVGTIVASTGFILRKRQKLELEAGKRFECFGGFSSRLVHWGVLPLFFVYYLFHVWATVEKARPGEFVFEPPSPVMVFFAVNFAVVRLWWKIDPLGLEACERGLILGGWRFLAWESIARYSWSGKGRRQLSLFLKTKFVQNMRVSASHRDRLDEILAEHMGHSPQLAPATA